MNNIETKLLGLYLEPHRYYHDINHVMKMLNLFLNDQYVDGLPHLSNPIQHFVINDEIGSRLSNVEIITDAIIAHDCVYVPGDPENEQRSADLYKMLMDPIYPSSYPEDTEFEDTVCGFVLATKTHLVSENERESNLALFLSLDLAEMASSVENFNRNSDLIAKEFSGLYTHEQIIAGRAKFFESYLERPYIFPHATLEKLWGDKARKNIEQGIMLCKNSI